MKILVVSDLYPPYYQGGYEVRCAQVAEGLRRAGHDVRVLTSAYGLSLSVLGNIRPRTEESNGVVVHRWLNQYAYQPRAAEYRPWTLFQARRELWDVRQFLKILATFQPDIVNWWNMGGLSKMLLPIPHWRGIADVHCIDDPWMIREYGAAGEKAARFWVGLWDGNWGPRLCRPLFRLIGRRWERRVEQEGIPTRAFPNRPGHVCFVSEYLRDLYRDAGLEFPSSEVIYGGVPTAQFHESGPGPRDASQPIRILYAGQLSQDRGLHTAIEALGRMDVALRSRLTLSVAGRGPSDYVARVKARVQELGLVDCVSFLGKVPHEQMPGVYRRHDMLVFPSTRHEGLPFTMIEAMLAGCAVVTTGSGGAREIAALADLPVFPKDDPVTLSQLLARLVDDRAEVYQIASRGQQVALREFTFDRMMAQWVATLGRLHERNGRPGSREASGPLRSAAL